MKKLFWSFIFICSLGLARGQELTGKYFIGGNVGFELSSATESANNISQSNSNAIRSYTIIPSFGYYLSNNLAVGLQLGYTSSVTHNDPGYNVNYTTKQKTITIAPLLRYTVPVTNKLVFNINITMPYTHITYTASDQNIIMSGTNMGYFAAYGNSTSNAIGLNISPGIQWFFKNNLALTGSLGSLSYTHTKTNSSGYENGGFFQPAATINNNDIRLSLTTGFSLGVAFYFGGVPAANNNEAGK